MTEQVLPLGTKVEHVEHGWIGVVGYGEGPEVMVIWEWTGGASYHELNSLRILELPRGVT